MTAVLRALRAWWHRNVIADTETSERLSRVDYQLTRDELLANADELDRQGYHASATAARRAASNPALFPQPEAEL